MPLANPKHERFAQELAKGKTATESYELAGYKPDDSHSSRLAGNGRIQGRIAELLGRAAEKVEITVASLGAMLIADRDLARDLGQTSAAVSAVALLGKLYGMVIERKEVGRPGEFEDMNADQLRDYIARGTAKLGQGSAPAAHTNGTGKPH